MRAAALVTVCVLAAVPGRGQSPEATPSPGPVVVKATASKTEVTIGETFTVDVKATGPAGTRYTFAAGASEEGFELRTPEASPSAPPPEPGVHRYEAAVFALGEAGIPPIPVRFRLADGTEGEARTGPIAVKVASLLPKDKEQRKLADIRGPAAVGIGRAFWAALAAAVLLVAGIVWWLWRRRRRAVALAAPAVPPAPPDVEALLALDRLAASGRRERGDYRAFYIELTAIVKRYLERRLEAPVLEMTSTETAAFLRAHPHGGDLLGIVRDLAEAADRIKFARGAGLAAEAERHIAAVRALVPALEARLRPVPKDPARDEAA